MGTKPSGETLSVWESLGKRPTGENIDLWTSVGKRPTGFTDPVCTYSKATKDLHDSLSTMVGTRVSDGAGGVKRSGKTVWEAID